MELFFGQLSNAVAKYFDLIAIYSLMVFYWHESVWAIGVLSILIILPYIIIAPWAGFIINRLPIKSTIFTAGVINALFTFLLFFVGNLYLFLLLIFLRSSAKVFFSMAEIVLMKVIVPEAYYATASSLREMMRQFAMLLGPAFCGLLLLQFSPNFIFTLTAVFFMISAFSMRAIDFTQVKLQFFKNQSCAISIKRIMGFFMSEFDFLLILLMLCFGVFILFTREGFLALLIKEQGLSMKSFGLLIFMFGFGGISSAIIAIRLLRKRSTITLILLGLFGVGGGLILAGSSYFVVHHLVLLCLLIAWYVVGFSVMLMTIAYQTFILRVSTANTIVYFSGVTQVFTSIAMVLAPLVGAVVIHHYKIHFSFIIFGINLCVITIILFLIFFWMKMKRLRVIVKQGEHSE